MHIVLGKWTHDTLEQIIRESSRIRDTGSRIDFLSRQFLDMDYKGSTLIGDIDKPEILVINMEGVDCFTFIDYIEAMRLSGSFSEFRENIEKVRYRSGKVTFQNRNHFFTDWQEFNSPHVDDVTEQIGKEKTEIVTKMLNKKEDGTFFQQGIQSVQREIRYIPSDAIDDFVINKLKTGDYAGIYSGIKGLDVSHVGIIIKDRDSIYLRHASSEKNYRRVVDQDFRDYIFNRPGLVVLRPKKKGGADAIIY